MIVIALFLVVVSLLAPRAASASAAGSLAGHRFTYADSYVGWPLAPRHRQHPIRGSFLEPRYPDRVYHWGLDINVRDDRPEAGAPAGRSHRAYSVEGGVVTAAVTTGPCIKRWVQIGHFAYWHVDTPLRRGQRVRPGQAIGWTCMGAWHLHLGEWTSVGGRRVWVNPLHAGGKLRPYVDTAPPVIRDIAFRTPAMPPESGRRLDPSRLSGVVDVNVLAGDPQSFHGWFTGEFEKLRTEHHPYELRAELRRRSDGRAVRWTVFRSDVQLDARIPSLGIPIPFTHHFAHGSSGMLKIPRCLTGRGPRAQSGDCGAHFRLRLFGSSTGAFWDTRTVRNGRYLLTVTALDTSGNSARARTELTVAN
jgi:hypothetical protein